MDFMNLFGKIGKEVVKEEENEFEKSLQFYESLSADEYVKLENIKKDIVTLAQKVGDTEISQELGIPLAKLRDWISTYEKSLYIETILSSDETIITKVEEYSSTDIPLETIQDENNILSFIYNSVKYTLNIKSEKARKDCLSKLKISTGVDFAWFKEEFGKEHWVLYDTRMYEVEDSEIVPAKHLLYRPEFGSIPILPFNATSCYRMFSIRDGVEDLNFDKFRTSHIVDMHEMFAYLAGVKEIILNSFNTENVINFQGMFRGCTDTEYIDLSSFKTYRAEDMTYMFIDCKNLRELIIIGFTKENLQTALGMFAECKNLIVIKTNYRFKLVSLPEIPEAYSIFEDCVKLPGFSPNYIGMEMAKPVEEGGYFTVVNK